MVVLGFAVEGALGFGATVITVAIASLWLPVLEILPVMVPVSTLLSCTLTLRGREHVAWRTLGTRILPWVGLGIPLGLYAVLHADPRVMKRAFGAFVAVLAVSELVRARGGGAPPPLSRAVAAGYLWLGGVVHGAFSSGGPLIVYAVGREIVDKRRFRSTLSAMWIPLNLSLTLTYLATGRIDAHTLVSSAALLPGLVLGLVLGERLHRSLPDTGFRLAVNLLLAGVGTLVASRA